MIEPAAISNRMIASAPNPRESLVGGGCPVSGSMKPDPASGAPDNPAKLREPAMPQTPPLKLPPAQPSPQK